MADAPQDQHGAEQAPTEWIASFRPPGDGPGAGSGATSGRGNGRGRGRLIIGGVVAAVVAVIAGGAVFAFQVLGGGGPQPDEVVPATAIGFVRVDLDPSAAQKVNALQLLRRVPQFEEETGITSDTDDLRRRLVELALEDDEGCPDVDYEDDVEPWLGDRAGQAVVPGDKAGVPNGLVVLQVTDEDAARDGLERLLECDLLDNVSDTGAGVAFVGDYALVAETQELADRFAADAEEAPLSEDADYQADMAALDGEGIVSAWVDVEAAIEVAGEGLNEEEAAQVAALSGFGEVDSLAAALRANSDSLEVVAAADGVPAGYGDTAAAVQELPATTMFAMGFTGGSELAAAGWSQFLESLERTDPGAADDVNQFISANGFQLPEDLQTLLGDDFALAVDGDALGTDLQPEPNNPASYRIGFRTSSDLAEVSDLVARIETLLSTFVPVDLVEREAEAGGSVVALNTEYADMLATDGGLVDTENYRAAVADPDSASGVYYFDFDRLLTLFDTVEETMGETSDGDVREAIEVLRSAGVSVSVDGDYTYATARLVFD